MRLGDSATQTWWCKADGRACPPFRPSSLSRRPPARLGLENPFPTTAKLRYGNAKNGEPNLTGAREDVQKACSTMQHCLKACMLMTNLPSADLYLPPSSLKPCYFLWKTITPDRRDVSIPSEQIECIQAMMTETERKRPRPSELSTAVCLSATITLIHSVFQFKKRTILDDTIVFRFPCTEKFLSFI